jgi:hypothetical protein
MTSNPGYRILTNPDPGTDDDSENEILNEIDDGVLGTLRDVSKWKEVSGVIPYNATYHFYWGQIPGVNIIKLFIALHDRLIFSKKLRSLPIESSTPGLS